MTSSQQYNTTIAIVKVEGLKKKKKHYTGDKVEIMIFVC